MSHCTLEESTAHTVFSVVRCRCARIQRQWNVTQTERYTEIPKQRKFSSDSIWRKKSNDERIERETACETKKHTE